MRARDSVEGSQIRRTRARPNTPPREPSDEEDDPDAIVGGGDHEVADLRQEIAELRLCVQDLKSRLEGIEVFTKEQFSIWESKITTFAAPQADSAPIEQMSPAAINILGMYHESKTGLKKIIRESIRLWMFSEIGSMYAPISKAVLAGERVAFDCLCNFNVADVCVVPVVSGIGQITRINWIAAVADAVELSGILVSVFDDLRRKFTSNIKNEFAVRGHIRTLFGQTTKFSCTVRSVAGIAGIEHEFWYWIGIPQRHSPESNASTIR